MNVRIIPCLDISNNRVVKGTKFSNLIDFGSPEVLFKKYESDGADEITLLDITATINQQAPFQDYFRKITNNKKIAVTAGGGLKTIEQVITLFELGADKVTLNSVLYDNPNLAYEISSIYGSQAVVCALDYRTINGKIVCVKNSGQKIINIDPLVHAKKMAENGCGEILLTCFDQDGTKNGYDLITLEKMIRALKVPIIASGGAGIVSHLIDAAKIGASGLLIAGQLHANLWNIRNIKQELKQAGLQVRI